MNTTIGPITLGSPGGLPPLELALVDGVPQAVMGVDLDDVWEAFFRMVLQDGRLVVAGLRIEPRRPAAIPAGGLSARALRQIRLGDYGAVVARIIDGLRAAYADSTTRWKRGSALRKITEAFLGMTGFGALLEPPATTPSGPRRGRRPLSDETLLAVAVAYDQAVRRGSREPVSDVAKRVHLAHNRTRDYINRARRRGFLTPGVRGRSGGDLTPRALALLKGSRSRRRPRR